MQMTNTPKQILLWLKNGLVFLSHFNVKLVKMNGNELAREKKHKTNERERNENLRTYFTQTRKEGKYINLN